MNSPTEKRLELKAQLNFRSDATTLHLLCSLAAVASLGCAVGSLSVRDKGNFLRGYRLAVATPLCGMLNFAVGRPELLGFKFDDRLFNWLNYRNPENAESIISAVSDPESDLSLFCCIFNDLHLALRRAEGGLTDTIAVIEKCRTFAKLFVEDLASAELVRLDTFANRIEDEDLLHLCVAERVLDYAEYDRSVVPMAHGLIWGRDDEWPIVVDRFVLDSETHLSGIPKNFLGKGIPHEWREGLLFGFDSIIKLSGIALPSLHVSGPFDGLGWLNEPLAVVYPQQPEGVWPSQMCGLRGFSRLNTSVLAERLGVEMENATSKNRLAAILGSDRVRLISDASGTDALELEIMLGGAIAAHGDSKIQLLILTHTVDFGDREWVSIAF